MKQILYTGLLQSNYKPLMERTFNEDQMVRVQEVESNSNVTFDTLPDWVPVGIVILIVFSLVWKLIGGPLKKIVGFILKLVFGVYLFKFLRK